MERTDALVRAAEPFSGQIKDLRLALEVAVIQNIARTLTDILRRRDPLSERVHLGKVGFALVGGLGAVRFLGSAMMRSVGARTKATA
jgi:hypothetical protein